MNLSPSKNYSLLFVDSDQKFFSSIESFASKNKTTHVVPKLAKTASDTEAIVKDSSIFLHSIYVNPGAFGLRVFKLLSAIHRMRPVTPVYFIYDDHFPLGNHDLSLIAIHESIQKSKFVSDHMASFAEKYHPVSDGTLNKALTVKFDRSSSLTASGEYIRLPGIDLLSEGASFFDVFVQSQDGNFQKIVDHGDSLTSNRIRIFLDRGVEYFFVKKQNVDRLVGYCELFSKNLLNHPNISPEVQTVEVLNLGQDIMDLIRTKGFNQNYVDLVIEYSKYVRSIIPKLKLQSNKLLTRFLNNLHAYDHAVTCTVISALIGYTLKLESEAVQKNLGLAAFFHDIGLMDLPPELQILKESDMTLQQKTLFHTHPERGSAVLSGISGVDEAVIQAVNQHHERKDKSGFPHQLSGQKINKIAEIIGMADEFADLLKAKQNNPEIDHFAEMEKKVFPKFSFQVVEGFKQTFALMK